jgi:starch synthase
MQVYFIDNEEYFKRKAVFTDEDDQLFEDNDERAIFFAKGVVETVKKLNWAPDIIHVHGWMASLLPLYLREFYNEEPLFTESKIITSIYNNPFEGTLNDKLADKIKFDLNENDKIATVYTPTHTNILKSAIENSDAIIHGSEGISEELTSFIEEKKVPVLGFQEENFKESYLNFYADLVAVK